MYSNKYKYLIKKVILIAFLVLLVFSWFPIVQSHSHDHGHSHDHEENPSFKYSKEANQPTAKKTKDDSNSKWVEAIGATLLISIAPYLILFFIPVTNSKEHEPYLKILLAFASGGLLGDAFLHLIPHSLMDRKSDSSHSHSHSHMPADGDKGLETHSHAHDTSIGMAVLCGIIAFLAVEKFVRIFNVGHSHSHLNGSPAKKTNGNNSKDKKSNGGKTNKKEEGIKVAAYLNLAADFTHNFTDGLAIGASFLAGKSIGIVTTLTIFLHEIPHEIGDFAILIQSGCSKRKAMLLQLVTAVGALAGTCVSLMVEGSGDQSTSWILPFTAGGFIYIATVSVIPDLLENSNFFQSVLEISALLLGVGLMMAITWVEEMGHI